MKLTATGIAGLAIAVLATVLVPAAASSPALAQSQTSWHVNDNPTLHGPSAFWYAGEAGRGYGSNNYRYTYAIGGASEPDNWAEWWMGTRVGHQEIQVYVPSNHATATVKYHVTIAGTDGANSCIFTVAQRQISGWHTLGNCFAVPNRHSEGKAVIRLYDNDAVQNFQRDGKTWSSIGVDAVRMRCVSFCGASSPPPPSQNERRLTISLGPDNSGDHYCPHKHLPCRWVNVTMDNFSAGTYWTRCVWPDESLRSGECTDQR